VKRLKKFNEFLFESAKDIADKYLNSEMYPWDDELIRVIEEIQSTVQNISEMNERRTQNDDRIYLDIKIYDRPDFEEMSKESGHDVEWLQSDYDLFLEDNVNQTIEDLEGSEWIAEAGVYGRSGGWLMIKFKKSIMDDYVIQDLIDYHLNEYNVFKEDYVFDEEELEQYQGSKGMKMSYDLGLAELPEGMEETIELSKKVTSELKASVLEELDSIKKIISDLKTRIGDFKTNSSKYFSERY
jgi:hypothetical protein